VALQSLPLARQAQHLFTTKQLRLRAADVAQGWDLVVAALSSDTEHLFRIKQVHGATVRVVRNGDLTASGRQARPEADAMISNVPGALLAVQVADCVPMLIADTGTGAVAAIHAGWRGTAAAIAPATVAALMREYGSNPADLIVALGPSIGACCYEVGEELVDAFQTTGGDAAGAPWFVRKGASLRLDLWQANRDQLVAAGVPPEQIHMAQLCTRTHADVFESYRAEGASAGRMIAAIRVPSR
jgi:YfiH family protein